jgi:TetR/AcrR family transcriptional regulator
MDDTKERIRSIALARFAERGYNAVGIQEICLLSGVTKPTLYYYFSSKRGLLEKIASDEYGAFLAAVDAASTYDGNIAETLNAAMRIFLIFASGRPDFMRLRLSLSFSPLQSEEHEIMRPYTERLYEVFKRLFRRAAQDHGNMRDRELAYAASFIATADAYAGLALADAFRADDEFVKRAVHYYMHGIFS